MEPSAVSEQSAAAYDMKLTWRGKRIVRPVPINEAEGETFITWLRTLNEAKIPFAVGGAYALYAYTGGWRNSKDLDVFLEPRDLKPALDALARAGFETEVRDRQWLAKVHRPPYFMDLLFALRHNDTVRLSEDWFASCHFAEFLGVPICFLAREELLASKVYLAARDRFDGADILHLIRAAKGELDWQRILALLGGDDLILLWHLILFQFVYPGHADYLPAELMDRAWERLRASRGAPLDPRTFQGMLLDPVAFATDCELWGYANARSLRPMVGHQGEPLEDGQAA